MGGMQKCFIKGLGDTHEAIEQLESEYHNLITLNYSPGENLTPYSFNGKQIYCWYYNNQTVNFPGTGGVAVTNNISEVIEANMWVSINSIEGGDWMMLPATKRNDAGQQITVCVNKTNNNLYLKNMGYVGQGILKGAIYYTKNDETTD